MLKHTMTQDNKFFHFIVEGHAGHSDGKEFDAVCGMVSVLAQAALYGCAKYCKKVKVTKKESGHLDFYFPKENEICKAICEAAHAGIMQVAEQFPQCFER